MSEAIISDRRNAVTYIQIWMVGSPDHQRGWLEVMRRRIGILTRQPGFVSMTLHVGLNGSQIAVYAQWETEDLARTAVNLPEAKHAHEEMAKLGTSEGTFYRVESVFQPTANTI